MKQVETTKFKASGLLLTLLVLSACGTPYREGNPNGGGLSPSTPNQPMDPNLTYVPPPSTSTTTNPEETADPGDGTGGTNAAYNESFSMMGMREWVSQTVTQTDQLLKVKITAQSPGQTVLPPDTTIHNIQPNFSAQYSCVKYAVKVLGRSVTTSVLAVPGANPNNNSPECLEAHNQKRYSQIINFSQQMAAGATSRDITVSVKPVGYDYYCIWWMNGGYAYYPYNLQSAYYSHFCPMKTVFDKHTLNGLLEVQVNGMADLK
jgi:hypothetical protein